MLNGLKCKTLIQFPPTQNTYRGFLIDAMYDCYISYRQTNTQSPAIIGAVGLVKICVTMVWRSVQINPYSFQASIAPRQAMNLQVTSQCKSKTNPRMASLSENWWMNACAYVSWWRYSRFAKDNDRSYIESVKLPSTMHDLIDYWLFIHPRSAETSIAHDYWSTSVNLSMCQQLYHTSVMLVHA